MRASDSGRGYKGAANLWSCDINGVDVLRPGWAGLLEETMNRTKIRSGAVAALLLGVLMVATAGSAMAQGAEKAKAKGPVEMTMYLTSVCQEAPFVLRYVETLAGLFGAQMKFKMEFIGSFEENKLLLDGGEKEQNGDILLACAEKVMPKAAELLRFVNCVAAESVALDTSLAICFEAQTVPKAVREKLDACRKSEGQKLLEDSVRRTLAAGISMSPTLVINGERVTGALRTVKLAHSVCAAAEKKPAVCGKLPQVKKYKVTLVQDSRCKDPEQSCTEDFITEVSGILEGQIFLDGLDYQRMDYTTAEGKAFFDKEKIPALPAFMLEKAIEGDDDVMAKLGRFLRKSASGDWYFLNAGQTYDPTREICDNGQDDNEDGNVDCADATCQKKLACRAEKPGLVELFIMSYCPYGVMAVNEVKRLQEAFGKDIQVEIHYVLADEEGEVRSLHGEEEILEDARQLCVAQKAPAKLLPYMWCLYADGGAAQSKPCLESVKVDADEIEACATGEAGKQMLLAEAKLGELFEIEASPTWIVHGREKFNSIDASEVAAYLCTEKFKVPGCEKAIPKKEDQPAGSCN